jgi:hypothetical protein
LNKQTGENTQKQGEAKEFSEFSRFRNMGRAIDGLAIALTERFLAKVIDFVLNRDNGCRNYLRMGCAEILSF